MTQQVIKFWKRMSFWFKLKAAFISVGVGSQAALYFADIGGVEWKIFTGVASAIAWLITHLIEDKDKNGEADIFQKPPRTP